MPLGVALLLAAGCVSAHMARTPPSSLVQGNLAPCPSTPNCVCSQDADPSHHIEPLHFEGPGEAALAQLLTLVQAEPRTTIVGRQPGYLRIEYRSRLFRFTDDVEFLLNAEAGAIEVRSASRVGHSDLGVNRRRVESLRTAFARAQAPVSTKAP